MGSQIMEEIRPVKRLIADDPELNRCNAMINVVFSQQNPQVFAASDEIGKIYLSNCELSLEEVLHEGKPFVHYKEEVYKAAQLPRGWKVPTVLQPFHEVRAETNMINQLTWSQQG